MLLQCETGSGAEMPEPLGVWLRGETLESLVELNEECLELLVEQARATPGSCVLTEIARLWNVLDAAGRRRAADCLYLFLDAGFAQPSRWCGLPAQLTEAAPAAYAPFFTVASAPKVAQAVFTFAWHLARCQGTAARLLLGTSGACVQLLARCTLRQIRALAEEQGGWLKPRWQAHPGVWRELLLEAALGESPALERARLRGQTLLAAEARQAEGGRRERAAAPPGYRGKPGVPPRGLSSGGVGLAR